MKKKILCALIAIASFGISAKAQIQKGNVLVGGDFANLSLGLDDSKIFNVNLTPKAAWFIQDNVALGGYVNLGIQTAHNSSTAVNYGVGALGRYYAGSNMTVLRHGRFFGEVNLGIGGINVSDGGGHTNGLDYGIGPGFAYFITPNIGLETLLKYNGVSGFGDAGSQHRLDLNFGLQIYLPGRSTAAKVRRDVK
jgi:hypothetical protein